MAESDFDFDVSVIDATDVEARIEVRARTPVKSVDPGDCHIRGTLTGPFCEATRTLPAKIPLRVVELGSECVAQVTVVDPCFWTREMPYVYRLEVEVTTSGQTRRHEQTIGLGRTREICS